MARGPKIKRSPMGYWRAGVLILVHVVIAIHIAHWLKAGTTLTPVEPSEAMEFSKKGVINAGLIFFALAILSTLILGRWFCGWGCHVVALQDFSRWLLGLVRIRPKPIRSRVLGFVPVLAFLYMFIAPLLGPTADRLTAWLTGAAPVGIEQWEKISTHFYTSGFWDTFPGPVSAILTFVVCGFVIIYFLGAKGFCFTGCPYGAIFGVADRFAPMRIVVNDDCTQSGHCTAVCTSNVRVHEEVRDFRRVVDSGCMKCLDCVSVCPNQALSFGLALPVGIGAPKRVAASTAKAPPSTDSAGGRVLGWLLIAAFGFAALLVFHGFDSPYRFRPHPIGIVQCAMLAVMALGVMALTRAPRHTPRGAALGEEALLAVFFLVAMVLFRGELVPFLFALGLAATFAFLMTQACLLPLRRQMSLQGWRLKREGRLQPASAAFGLLIAALLGLSAYAGSIQLDVTRTRDMEARLTELRGAAAAANPSPALLEEAIGLNRELARRRPEDLARVLHWGRVLSAHGKLDVVSEMYDAALKRHADSGALYFQIGMLNTLRPGNEAKAVSQFEAAVKLDPQTAQYRLTLAQAYWLSGRPKEAIETLSAGVRHNPDDIELRLALGSLLFQLGDRDAARPHVERAAALAPNREDVRQAMDAINRP